MSIRAAPVQDGSSLDDRAPPNRGAGLSLPPSPEPSGRQGRGPSEAGARSRLLGVWDAHDGPTPGYCAETDREDAA